MRPEAAYHAMQIAQRAERVFHGAPSFCKGKVAVRLSRVCSDFNVQLEALYKANTTDFVEAIVALMTQYDTAAHEWRGEPPAYVIL